VLGAGSFFFSASMLARSASIRLTTPPLLQRPLAKHTIRLAAATRAAEENLREVAINEHLLRPRLWAPNVFNAR